jgi:hypothetical protein
MERVEDIKRPLKIGEIYIVPCIVKEIGEMLFITPVINHPHNDKENGQQEIHYHVDYRFVKHNSDAGKLFPTVVNKHSKHYFVDKVRPQIGLDGKLEYIVLPVLNEDFSGITPVQPKVL